VCQIGETVSSNFDNEPNSINRPETPDVPIEAYSDEESSVECDVQYDVPPTTEEPGNPETDTREPSRSQMNSPVQNLQNPVSGNFRRERERAIQSERARRQNKIERAKLEVFVELKKTTAAMRKANEEEFKVNIEAAKNKAEAYKQKKDYYKLKLELLQSNSAGYS
uniref:Uncharacterized protein n=1 Tax=Phlebotomus papatasi TaxID=29031 RepID=A0A1B0D7D5_PHLPP